MSRTHRLARPRRSRPRLGVAALEPREVPASLAGRVFLDFDNSGTAATPDTGVAGVTLTLTGGALTTPLTTTTDSQGNYTFTNLAAGTYTVTETQPTSPANQSGKVTAGTAGGTAAVATNAVSGIVLGATTAATGYNFAEVPLVSTGGTVFEDTNGNGQKDSGEPGIPNVTVTLSGTSVVGGVITPKTATTDASGNYTFTGLTPGTYMLVETQPAGYSDGGDQSGTPAPGTKDNDRFLGIDLTKSAAPSGGFNFGEVKGGTLSGVVFNDANNDGTQAASGEPGIPGVKVRLTGTDTGGTPVDKTTTTGADGSYTFSGLKPGTYSVREEQPATYVDGKEKAGSAGGTTTTNDQITGIPFTSGAVLTGYTFGEQARADLALTASPAATTIGTNGLVTVTYTVRNRGSAAATAATVLANYGGLTFVSASNTTAFNATTKTWTVGDLAPGATQTIRLTFRGTVDGTFAPSATAATTATELKTTNNKAAATVTVGTVSAPTPTPTGGGGWGGLWANLMARFNQYNPLTRLWLFQRFFG